MAKLFRRDSKGIARLLKSPEMAAAIRSRAERIADVARAETELEIVVDLFEQSLLELVNDAHVAA